MTTAPDEPRLDAAAQRDALHGLLVVARRTLDQGPAAVKQWLTDVDEALQGSLPAGVQRLTDGELRVGDRRLDAAGNVLVLLAWSVSWVMVRLPGSDPIVMRKVDWFRARHAPRPTRGRR